MIGLSPINEASLSELPDLGDHRALRRTYDSWQPREQIRLIKWARREIWNDQGRPYDHAAYPHLGAPGGPMDAFDHKGVREIAMEFATRLGKSFLGQCMILYTADVDPAPTLVASESERSLKRINKRTYNMIYNNRRLRGKLRYWHERDHKQDFIEFAENPIFGGWARSAGTLADMNIKIAWANEFDKEGWEQRSTSKEGAPLKLFSDRLKDYWSIRKIIWESTPTIRGMSRVEAKRVQGNDCRMWVPCPQCKKYQILKFADCKISELAGVRQEDINIKYLDDGQAAYCCEHCGGACEDHHRPWMMRRGVWAPRGCTVKSEVAFEIMEAELKEDRLHDWSGWDDAEWIEGEPETPMEISSYQLSSLYALSLGWKDILSEFLSSQRRVELLRNFVNQWLGRTWELIGASQTWQQLYQKIVVKTPPLVVPETHSLLTCGIDKQQSHYVYVVDSWGPGRCSHTLDYGTFQTLDELVKEVLTRKYRSEDGRTLKIALSLIDRGFEPKTVDDFCVRAKKKGIPVMACRGSSQAMQSTYSKRKLGKDSATPGMPYIMIDGTSTQDWLNLQLHVLVPPAPSSTTLFDATEVEHQDFLEQVLNEAPLEEKDKYGRVKRVWVRPNEDIPNDYRDCKRYSAVGMLVVTRGRIIRAPAKPEDRPPEKAPKAPSPADQMLQSRPGGWAQDWRKNG